MYEDYIQDAIEMVSCWDLPEDQFCQAIQHKAELMIGLQLDDRDTWLSVQFESIRSH